MTTPEKEEMSNLSDKIGHLEARLETFKNLKAVLRDIRTTDTEVLLDAPLHTKQVTVRVKDEGSPSEEMLKILELQDGSNNIEYIPKRDEYSLKAVFWEDR